MSRRGVRCLSTHGHADNQACRASDTLGTRGAQEQQRGMQEQQMGMGGYGGEMTEEERYMMAMQQQQQQKQQELAMQEQMAMQQQQQQLGYGPGGY